MINQYFTPSIEAIRVGYECEQKHTGTWIIVKADRVNQVNSLLYEFTQARMDGIHVRTAYLTKEQIEAEGWLCPSTDKYSSSTPFGMFFTKDNYGAGFLIDSKKLVIIMKDVLLDKWTEHTSNGQLYYGECKDINTFRYICKLLGI